MFLFRLKQYQYVTPDIERQICGGQRDFFISPPLLVFSNTFLSRIVGLMTESSFHDLLFSYSIRSLKLTR